MGKHNSPIWEFCGFNTDKAFQEFLDNYGVTRQNVLLNRRKGYTGEEIVDSIRLGIRVSVRRSGVLYKGTYRSKHDIAKLFGKQDRTVIDCWNRLGPDETIYRLENNLYLNVKVDSLRAEKTPLSVDEKRLASMYNISEAAVRHMCKKYPLEDVEVYYQTGVHPKYQNSAYIIDGKIVSDEDVAKLFGRSKKHVAGIRRRHGRDLALELLQSESPRRVCSTGHIVIDGRTWSYRALAIFLHVNPGTLWYHLKNIEEYIISLKYYERLKFEDVSNDVTHVTQDLWTYKCPECARTVLCSTDELIDFKHNEDWCILHCVDEEDEHGKKE